MGIEPEHAYIGFFRPGMIGASVQGQSCIDNKQPAAWSRIRRGESTARATMMCEGFSASTVSRLRLKDDNNGEVASKLGRIGQQLLPDLIPLEDGDRIQSVHRFSQRANWLVPGAILLGKYPGQIPADLPPDWPMARDRIREIVLKGGVTDLLCLQAELPPQADESLWESIPEEDGVFFAGFRAYRGDAMAAVAEGGESNNVFAINESGAVAASKMLAGCGQKRELEFHHFPIPDLSPAENMEILSGLVDDLEVLVRSGKVVFIHCWAGRGRTGLVSACLLGKLYPELTAEQSLSRVDAYYRTRGVVAVGKTCRVSPETEEQEDQVRSFFKHVLKRS